MASHSQRHALLATILITICLDVSSIVAAAAAAMWNPKTSRYAGGYNLGEGPVFYEAYYPDTRDDRPEKRYFGRNTVLETSFQVPLERFAYSAETGPDHPISINESFVVVDNAGTLPREERRAVISRRNYDAITSPLAPLPDERPTIRVDDEEPRVANIEEISKLVRRAISRDLENWNALEGYLDRTIHQDGPRLGMHGAQDSPDQRPSILEVSLPGLSRLPRKLDGKQRPIYLEEVDTNASTAATSETRVGGARAVDTPPPIDVISDSLPLENIFQPRPQLIKYTFFKRPASRRLAHARDKQDESTTSLPQTTVGNLVREENVKVTSIEVSELPRHKTRHRHGEWPKRDYSVRRRSRPTHHPTVS
ncbi:PREDICTED: uncharacterized protein LOC105557702 [Vollenhovia emeryi]|uniref:uncharacterized protein LOC105557702 n=1 Tax=Vollenhovia emeryi TaxID=411798 RepID=UPI0005F4D5EC|nr:PREDICTED: uncharacterized protein LOC105557702 [Vollenhovia emeryi]